MTNEKKAEGKRRVARYSALALRHGCWLSAAYILCHFRSVAALAKDAPETEPSGHAKNPFLYMLR